MVVMRMPERAFYLEDELHCDQWGPYESWAAAMAELRRFAAIAWDSPPNLAPCQSWRKCGRRYLILEYDTTQDPWQQVQRVHFMDVRADGVHWVMPHEPT